MKHETISINGGDYPLHTYQTIIVGSGAAGLNAAVSLHKAGQTDIAIVTEGRQMGTSRNTGSDKQTYYKLTTCGSEPDSIRQMAETLYAGEAMDGDLALVEAALSVRSFYHLVDIGVPFPHNGAGEYVGYKTDHDPNQRGTSAGPLTSKFMTEALWQETEQLGISVFDGYQVIELLTETKGEEIRVNGIMAIDKKAMHAGAFTIFSAENVIYATGGEAGLYETSVYPVSQSGGMGVALRAGAKGKNLTESQYGIASVKFRWNLSGTYQQVIPRYVSTTRDGKDEREFLDEYFDQPEDMLHAIFLKGYQWPFDPRKVMNQGSSLIDLMVYQETVIRGRRVYLDYRHNPARAETNGQFDAGLLKQEAFDYLSNSSGLQNTPIERLEHMNPGAIELYQSHNIDLHREMLEIAVCAQHNNGGLSGNWWWESNIRHLFPVGEVNGSHGVYRPGGSALNSGQVGSLRAAQFITIKYRQAPDPAEVFAAKHSAQMASVLRFGLDALARRGNILNLKEERRILGARMSRYAANIRSLEGIIQAQKENKTQMERLENGAIRSAMELKSYYRTRDLLVSQAVYLEAIKDYILRQGKSRGSYLIKDQSGEKPLPVMSDEFRFLLDDGELSDQIQEIQYENKTIRTGWRNRRTIPKEDNWFERVWKDYREQTYC